VFVLIGVTSKALLLLSAVERTPFNGFRRTTHQGGPPVRSGVG
jgi:hypothetical protein